MMLEDFILSLGHEVRGPCESVDEAMRALDGEPFDLAILDVNLKGESVWPVATQLRDRGIPFVLASGGHVEPPPGEFADVAMIEKPYTIDRVTPVIDAALAE
ncbi:response regulator [Sphingomonas rhizophila]|uniref:Response regulator n=2 Tax=Sphingomonas rhizophila TaxID=2071607 RepID=A0A7G9SEB5_9SPHN|nr:response regulator [Sphingomonas rhizophila]